MATLLGSRPGGRFGLFDMVCPQNLTSYMVVRCEEQKKKLKVIFSVETGPWVLLASAGALCPGPSWLPASEESFRW